MKIFCAYAFTGEKEEEVAQRMRLVTDVLLENGHQVYCNLFDPKYSEVVEKGVKTIFAHAFAELRKFEVVVGIISSERRSVGQLMEMGGGMALGKPIYLMEHRSAADTTYLPALAEKTWSWETLEELRQSLKELSELLKTTNS